MKEPTVFTRFNALGVGSVLILIGYVIYRAALWGVNMDHFNDPSIVGKVIWQLGGGQTKRTGSLSRVRTPSSQQ